MTDENTPVTPAVEPTEVEVTPTPEETEAPEATPAVEEAAA